MIRKYVQAAVLVGFAMAAFWGLPISNCSIKIGGFRLVYPAGFLEAILLNRRINMDLVPGMILAGLLLVFFGRFYCSWICSASSANRMADSILPRVMPQKHLSCLKRSWQSLRKKITARLNLGYGDAVAIFSGIIAGIVIFDFPLLTVFNPMGIISRSIIEFATHHTLRYDLLLLSVPLIISLFFENGWKDCCPEGLLQSFAARFNRTLIPVVDAGACRDCTKCKKACPVGISAVDAVLETASCQKCLQCVDVCPTQAVSLSLWGNKGESGQGVQEAEPQPQTWKPVLVPSLTSSGRSVKKNRSIIPLKRHQDHSAQKAQ